MATVHEIASARKPLRHYAHLGDLEGIARLVPGGYLFTADATGERRLVAYTSPELVLHGYVEDLDANADLRPLWMQLADPSYYNGTTQRGTLAGGR
jgi:hypothetical protein